MPVNHVLLETIELSQTAASVTFDNIPQTGYSGLKVVGSIRSDYSGQGIALRINPNGSSANMTSKVLLGSGSAASSFSDTIAYASAVADTSTANAYNNVEWYIPNYTSSNNKPISIDFVTETNATAAIMGLSANLWSSSSAMTSLVILVTSGNLMAGSTLSLYGIAAIGTTPTIGPKAQGGNIVANDGTYWYHAFLSSGTFTPTVALTADTLVVAGGGGGGAGQGGGGGAGGVLYSAAQSFSGGQSYTASIGAGGAGGTRSTTSNGTRGTSGSNSVISTQTAIGGGGGGNYDQNVNGLSGGSGGGAGASSVSGSGGGATSGQGFAGGGNGTYSPPYYGGGGGGAGGVGSTGGTLTGSGGPGISTYTSWHSATSTGVLSSSLYYIGGGGAGAGETATASGGVGGGANSSSSTPTAAIANTGGGGGATTYNGSNPSAGAGGSGLIIIRYTMA
jgi:hypothetical protein